MASPHEPASSLQNSGQPANLTRRVLIAILVFGVVLALSLILPRALPGEMATTQLTPHAGTSCAACPPTDQLTGVGLLPTDDGLYVNVELASTPLNTLLRVSFAGIPGEVDVQQSGQGWHYAANTSTVQLTGVIARNNKVVLVFPSATRTSGVAVSTGTGDQLPASGFVAPTYPAPPHFNATDVVLLLALTLTAVYGYRRGFMVEASDLVILALSLTVSAIAFRPVAAVFIDMVGSQQAAAVLSSSLLVVVLAVSGVFLAARFLPRLLKTSPFDARTNAILGSFTGCLRQLPVLALLLAAGTGLTVLHWASSSINSSLLGSALVQAWKGLFPATPG